MFHELLDTADLCKNAEEELEVYRENAFSDLLKHPGYPHVFASVGKRKASMSNRILKTLVQKNAQSFRLLGHVSVVVTGTICERKQYQRLEMLALIELHYLPLQPPRKKYTP